MRRIIVILLITAAAGWVAMRVAATSPIVHGNLANVVAHPGDGEDDHLDPGTMIGVGTCARCHGEKEEVGGSQKHWKSAYTAWINRDPHRRAFAVLYSVRSVRIIKKLTAVDQQPISDPQTPAYESYLKDKCTACHATAQEEVEDYTADVFLEMR